MGIAGVMLLLFLIFVELAPTTVQAVAAQHHTVATVNEGCDHFTFSSDGKILFVPPPQAPIPLVETASGGHGNNGTYWATISHSIGAMPPIGSLTLKPQAYPWAQLHVLARSLYFHAPMECGLLVPQGTWPL